jgi:hypothetical protein
MRLGATELCQIEFFRIDESHFMKLVALFFLLKNQGQISHFFFVFHEFHKK